MDAGVGRSLLVILAVALPWSAARAQVGDHLRCHGVKDPLALRGRVTIESPQLGADVGCELGAARLFCTPAVKTVLQSNVPLLPIGGDALTEDRVCYKVRCRPRPGTHEVSDQFGTRRLRRLAPKLLCTPAIAGPPVPTETRLDHLACYRARDTRKVRARLDLDAPALGLVRCATGAERLFCVPGSAMVLEHNAGTLLAIGGACVRSPRSPASESPCAAGSSTAATAGSASPTGPRCGR
jgi:hypothetical protein